MIIRKVCTCPAPLVCPHDWLIVRPTWRVILRRGWRWLTRPPGAPGRCPACGGAMTGPLPGIVRRASGRAAATVILEHCADCGWTRID